MFSLHLSPRLLPSVRTTKNVVDFDAIDQDKDNFISFNEFQRWFDAHKQSKTAQNVAYLFKSYDSNSDSRLSISEFVPLAYEINKQPENGGDEIFKHLDADKNGVLTHKELEQSNENLGAEIINGLFTVADTNNDGRITYEEFEKIAHTFGGQPTRKRLGIARSLMEAMDKNQDQRLSEREVFNFVNQFNKVNERTVASAFQQLDASRDGLLSLEELQVLPQRIIDLAGFQTMPSV
ncbi:hypothetical protein M3Y99_00416000 [Aphelenchoides fujianensis]|nr:hypothetical protein M3Y99_00416000 [Aphelenchoides fujianensis]